MAKSRARRLIMTWSYKHNAKRNKQNDPYIYGPYVYSIYVRCQTYNAIRCATIYVFWGWKYCSFSNFSKSCVYHNQTHCVHLLQISNIHNVSVYKLALKLGSRLNTIQNNKTVIKNAWIRSHCVWNLAPCCATAAINTLTRYGTVTPHGDINLGQHWPR